MSQPNTQQWGPVREHIFMRWAEQAGWDAARIAKERHKAVARDKAQAKADEMFRKRWDRLDEAIRSTGLMADGEARMEAWLILSRMNARKRRRM